MLTFCTPDPRWAGISLTLLALATAMPAVAFAQDQTPQPAAISVEDLARRLQALEQRLGGSALADRAGADNAAVTTGELDQRLRVLERKLELQDEAAATKAASTPTVSLSPAKGLSVKSPSGDAEVKLKGLVQLDHRFYLDDAQNPQNDTFLLRRVEPMLEGNWGPFGFRLSGQFAGDSATILDAYVDLKFDPRAVLRIGKTKVPIGLERLQSNTSTGLVETGFPSELVPSRDLGVQLQGELAQATVSYAVGVYNGAVDGRDGATTNPDGEFEVAGRLFFEPWKNDSNALSGLGFGSGASSGAKHGGGSNSLPRYRTPGQVQFFNYRSAVVADGDNVRWAPQAYFYRNALGLLGEYTSSSQQVLLLATGQRASLDHRAWQLVAGYVLTGEDASYRGVTKPNHPFALDGTGWGALELIARYGGLEIDDAAFPLFADPAAVSSAANSWGVGLNWYLTSNFKLMANYIHTSFEGDASGGLDREDEQAFFTRAQFAF